MADLLPGVWGQVNFNPPARDPASIWNDTDNTLNPNLAGWWSIDFAVLIPSLVAHQNIEITWLAAIRNGDPPASAPEVWVEDHFMKPQAGFDNARVGTDLFTWWDGTEKLSFWLMQQNSRDDTITVDETATASTFRYAYMGRAGS